MGQTRDFTFFTFLINDETFHQQLQDAVQVDLDDDSLPSLVVSHSLPSLVSDSDDDIEESKGAAGHEWVEEDDGDGGVEEDDDDGGVEESKDHTPTVVFADPELYAKLLLSETEFWESFVVGGPSLLSKNVNSVKQVVNGTLTN
jgi:hypothetical protein